VTHRRIRAGWVSQPQAVWLRQARFKVHLWSGPVFGLYVVMIHRATAWLLDRHDNLLEGRTGRRISGIGALALLLLCVTGPSSGGRESRDGSEA
jgi:uncharacterized iron-regulated membrane protein